MLRRLAPRAILAFAVTLVVLPIAFSRSLWLKDVMLMQFPQKMYVRARLLAGELPLWWREAGLGRPIFGELQPGAIYPLNVLTLLPVPFGLNLFCAVHLFILGFGMRAWLRRLEIAEIPAIAGALVVTLSGYFLSMFATNPLLTWSAAWVPWILAVAARRDQRLEARAAKIALLSALALSAGDPQALFFAYLLLGVQALVSDERRALAMVAGAGVLAILIGLVILLPGLEAASVGRPGGVPIEDARHFALHPARLVELVWPGAFGEPYGAGWFVTPLYDEGTGKSYTPFAIGLYLGLATPLLAAAALISRGRRRIDVALASFALLMLIIAFGEHAPLWRPFFRFFPGARLFRYPEKYLFPVTLCAGVLAARGLELVVAAPRRALAVGAVAFGLLGLAGLGAAWKGPALASALVGGRLVGVTPEEAGHVLAACAGHALLIAGALLLPLVLAVRGRLREQLAAILTVLLAADLLAGNVRVLGWTSSSVYTERIPMADDVKALAGAQLAEQRLYRPSNLDLVSGRSTPETEPWMTRATLTPDCGVELGIIHLDAYEIFHTARETRLWAALRAQPLRLLQLTSTRLALLGNGQLGPVHPGLDVKQAYPAIGASLVAVAGVAPLVYLAGHAQPAASIDEAATVVASPGFAVGRDAVVEGGEARDALGRCTLDGDGLAAETVRIRCEASAPSYVIVNEGLFPGWRASVGGRAAPILPANVALRAVPIPAGASAIELRYRPRGLGVGAAASLAGLVLALVLLRRRTR